MMEELKRIFLAGVGITSTSIEKAEQVIDEMVEKGRMTVQEGKELQSELTRKMTDSRPAMKGEMTALRQEVEQMGFAKQEDLQRLEEKLNALDNKIDMLLNKE